MHQGNTPPLLVRSIQRDLDGTQYAKGRYAVRRNSVISYADINLYFKKVLFSSKSTTHVTYKVARSLRSRFFGIISAFINVNMDLGRSKSSEFNKQTHQT